MRPLLVLVVLALLAAPSLAAVKRPRNGGAADANPMPQKAGKGDDDESPHDFLDVESRGDCESCANRGAVDPSPADDSFLQLSATSQSGTHTRARRAVFSASALNELLLHNSAQHRVTLGAKATAVINSFRNLAKTAAGAAGMPNLHYLRLWLGQAAVVGANTAAAFKDPKPYAYAAAAPVLPAAPAWGAATTALHFPQGAHTVTHRNWVYTLDVYGRITQVTGAVRSNAIAGGTAPKGVTRDFVNAIADVNAAAAGWHAGHVRAAAFGGNFDILNFVPEAANVNTGIQCRIESLLVEMTAGIAGPHNLHSTLTITYTYPAFGAAPNAAFYRPSTIQVHAVPLAGAPAAAAGWVQAAGQTIDITFPNA